MKPYGFGDDYVPHTGEAKPTPEPHKQPVNQPIRHQINHEAIGSTIPYVRLCNRAAGPEIVDFCGLNGPLLPQNQLEKVGGFAPHLFQ